MGTIVLADPPRLSALFGRAVLTARGRHGGQLPDNRFIARDVHIDPAALADYARVCGFGVGDVLPATYPHLLAFPLQVALMVQPGFPLALPGLVHVRNTIVGRRAIRVDERPDITVWAEHLATHRSGTTIDLCAAVTVDSAEVWTSRSSYLARGISAPADSPAAANDLDIDVPSTTVAIWQVPKDAGRRYAAVSGDVNPIHLSALSAKAFGFQRAIAHGMWLTARVLAAFEGRLPDAVAMDVAFRKPLYLPSTVALATTRADNGWDVGVRSADHDIVHLVGNLRPA